MNDTILCGHMPQPILDIVVTGVEFPAGHCPQPYILVAASYPRSYTHGIPQTYPQPSPGKSTGRVINVTVFAQPPSLAGRSPMVCGVAQYRRTRVIAPHFPASASGTHCQAPRGQKGPHDSPHSRGDGYAAEPQPGRPYRGPRTPAVQFSSISPATPRLRQNALRPAATKPWRGAQ